ncbi:16383_t:CDS:2, partial [Gigaspora rosea]
DTDFVALVVLRYTDSVTRSISQIGQRLFEYEAENVDREGCTIMANGLMEIFNKTWKLVSAVDTTQKPKSASGLADDDKGQLLDYVRVLIQQQSSRQMDCDILPNSRQAITVYND